MNEKRTFSTDSLTPEIIKKEKMEDRIIPITSWIQRIYLAFLCLGTVDLIMNLSEATRHGENIGRALNIILYIMIYFGLRQRRKWLIPLVLISACWLLISTFLSALQPAKTGMEIAAKFIAILLVIFCAYQIHYFSKRPVRQFFGVKGKLFY